MTIQKAVVVGYIGVPTTDGRIIDDVMNLTDHGPPLLVPLYWLADDGFLIPKGGVEVHRSGPELVASLPWWRLRRMPPQPVLGNLRAGDLEDVAGTTMLHMTGCLDHLTFAPGPWAWRGVDAWAHVRRPDLLP